MHELTLLVGVARRVGEVVHENGLDHIDAIVLDVGEVTGVIPMFLQDGYSILSDEYDYLKGSHLIVNTIKGIARCRCCGREYPVVDYKGVCPDCESNEKDLIRGGHEFIIKEVRVLES